VVKDLVGDRLPKFTAEQKALIKGSNDFFGLNHYTTQLIANSPPNPNPSWSNDQRTQSSLDPKWNLTVNGWAIVPSGLYNILKWIDNRYGRPPIVLTENGCASVENVTKDAVDDPARISFLTGYMNAAKQAIAEGVDLRGYFVWSFMDNFEWASGYSIRFGIHRVDYTTLQRTPKSSAKWLAQVIQNNGP